MQIRAYFYGSCVQILQMHDAGTYTLVAENRNGSDQIDLDLIVLDQMDDGKCDMFKHGTLGCTCSAGFR